MTTYRLPDGTEATATLHGAKAWVKHTTLGTILVDSDKLTEVKPPLPPEPPEGSVVLDHEGDAWQRHGSWRCPNDKDDRVLERGWSLLNEEFGPLRRLVPDPSADAPGLPWTLGDHKDRVAVMDNGLVWIFLEPDYHSPEEARLRAAAILRAAREADPR